MKFIKRNELNHLSNFRKKIKREKVSSGERKLTIHSIVYVYKKVY